MCVIWLFDEMGLGEQVILSYKGNRGIEQIVNHENSSRSILEDIPFIRLTTLCIPNY